MPKSTASPSFSSGPFVEVSTKLYIHLPPCFATKPTEGIQEQLNGFLMRYMPQVDGVVLAHSDLKLLQESGRIMYDSPYCHFWISVKLLVWKPTKGSKLHGTINLQSPDHIGLLLYGTFNASIPSEFIPKDKYEFNPNSSYSRVKQQQQDGEEAEGEDSSSGVGGLLNGEWVVKSTGESIGHEGVIEFEVSDLVRTNDMLTVTGSLVKVPVTMRRPSMMVKSTSSSDPVQKKRSAPEEDEGEAVASQEADLKRIKKEKKEKVKDGEDKTEDRKIKEMKKDRKEKKDKKEKKEKKEKKIKAEA
ncbi:hypothetical protein BC939DRAFT_461016 [Gamsiella multidivaricata]|uniref:uncharacterized protein n=1 Tax=Gamsiella multidivaricata TaxID=101098 RepID=UPI00221F22E6|nr:uncharacterized protein BC939DRAFT_461016 [Gamsiella multidivaricata]KAG0369463.1 hypothetical protein BGZ54_009887 [Gamsiella multidivaricata]KAI7819182.1 hypothetical protein BC939DRAFT_461016 [Gamsiella multidivaricata]